MQATIDPAVAAAAAAEQQPSLQGADFEDALGRDEFMKLLVAKLQAQDPLNPATDTDFIDQLATFSSLEQLVSVNDNLQGLASMQNEMLNAQALDLIGKEALVENDGELVISNGSADELFYELGQPAAKVTVSIFDEHNQLVRTLDLDPLASGRTAVNWDGLDADGERAPDGKYRLDVQATGQSGEKIPIGVYRSIFIDGVNFADGSLSLSSNGREIPFESILEIRSRRAATP